ncbi:hypothetical protein Tsubulata_001191, partial [Turnera subulata]
GEMFGAPEFIIRIGMGSPPCYQYLVFDTGGDLLWFQCQPCIHCYSQFNTIYDSKKLNKYREASCLNTNANFYKTNIVARINNVYTRWVIGIGIPCTISNATFGCGYKNKGTFLNFAGILGFGGGDLSFIGNVEGKGTNFRKSISIEQHRQGRSCFRHINFSDRLAYDTFRDAFIAKKQHIPRVHKISLFDTCYNVIFVHYHMLPNVSLHFAGGPVLVLMANNILVEAALCNRRRFRSPLMDKWVALVLDLKIVSHN